MTWGKHPIARAAVRSYVRPMPSTVNIHPADKRIDIDRAAKGHTLEADLAMWAQQQAARPGITLAAFEGVWLEWALGEDLANDGMTFRHVPRNHQVEAPPFDATLPDSAEPVRAHLMFM